jgi:hypothetical protein
MTIEDLRGLPRRLKLPRGIAAMLACEGVIHKTYLDRQNYTIWEPGVEYTRLMKVWEAKNDRRIESSKENAIRNAENRR